MKTHREKGFTLLELLIVIAIIGVIVSLSIANLMGARGRARDARAKAEMREVKNALRMYYNDFQNYPPAGGAFQISGCGTDHLTPCPAGCTNEFSAGGTDCNDATLYMKRFPRTADGSVVNFTYTLAGSDDFCLVTTLENPGDQDILVSQQRCAVACGASLGATDYATCAD